MSLINQAEFNRLLTEANGDPKKHADLFLQVASSFGACVKQLQDSAPDNTNMFEEAPTADLGSDSSLEKVQESIAQLVKYVENGELDANYVPAFRAHRQDVIAPITGHVLADAFAGLEMHNEAVRWVLVSATEYADLRKLGKDIIDFETRAPWCKVGVMGTLWGARIITNRSVPSGTVYLVNDMESSVRATKFTVIR